VATHPNPVFSDQVAGDGCPRLGYNCVGPGYGDSKKERSPSDETPPLVDATEAKYSSQATKTDAYYSGVVACGFSPIPTRSPWLCLPSLWRDKEDEVPQMQGRVFCDKQIQDMSLGWCCVEDRRCTYDAYSIFIGPQ
jgi:hypothetical protein